MLGEDGNLNENLLVTGISEQDTNEDILENQSFQNEACLSESEISQRMGELEVEIAHLLEMKKKLMNDPTYDDAPWKQGHPDFPKWIPMIKENQADILPVDLIETKRYVSS